MNPLIIPLGDRALVVRFGTSLDETANRRAIRFAHHLDANPLEGVVELTPNLVSVLLAFDPKHTTFERLAGELRLLPPEAWDGDAAPGSSHRIGVAFDGEDLAEVAALTGCDAATFASRHNAEPLRVLATGFAPGFVYCGFHPEPLQVPRRTTVRGSVPAGTVLFAAGQTAIAATAIPTGWHVIGHTAFRNFHPAADPPTSLRPGDTVIFEAVS